MVVEGIRFLGDSIVATRPPMRPGDAGAEVRLASADVLSLREVHPDQAGLAMTAAVIGIVILPLLWFLTHAGSD
jgi:hypothetical protein